MSEDATIIRGETCPICGKKELVLTELKREIPYFGTCYLFSMTCEACHYHKADVEVENNKGPKTYTLTVENEDDLKARVVKSSHATVKIGTIGTIEPGETSNGYITNIEGLINRMKKQIESIKKFALEEGDKEKAKKAKNALKKINKVLWGSEKIKITIKDPSGNSAIISEKAEVKNKA